jgi:protein-glucosylgalactosylhydroxylysine glucosidase
MKLILTFFIFHFSILSANLFAQAADPWIIRAQNIDPSNYYGITVANGMIGIVSSPEPFKIKDVVLAGAYDQYGRGRVSNFLRSFNLLNMNLEIDGKRMDGRNVTNFKQELDMRQAKFTASFDFEDKATVFLFLLFTSPIAFYCIDGCAGYCKKRYTYYIQQHHGSTGCFT